MTLPFPGRSAVTAALLLFLWPAAARATLSWTLGGSELSGPGGYVESTIEAGVSSRTRSKWYPADRAWAFASRTTYGLKTSTETTATYTFGGGLDFKRGVGLNASFWLTPPPRPLRDGSYQGRGAEAGAWVMWDGIAPGLRFPSFLTTFLSVSGGQSIHEEYFTTPIPNREVQHWFRLRQTAPGAGLTWILGRRTFLSAEGRAYSYDQDVRQLSQNLEFMALSSLGAANTYDMVLGFPRKSWGFGASQLLWSWGDLSAGWRRTVYVIGGTPRSDTWSGSASLHFWRRFGVRGRYEVSRPLGGKAAAYKGVGVEAGF